MYEPPDDLGALNMARLVIEAKWAGVEPWELVRQPVAWRDAIQLAREIEASLIRNRKAND